MARSSRILVDCWLMYFGKMMAVRKKTVATSMTWLDGKEGSPEPSGRVFQIKTLSKITYVIPMSTIGTVAQRSPGSIFLKDLRVIH